MARARCIFPEATRLIRPIAVAAACTMLAAGPARVLSQEPNQPSILTKECQAAGVEFATESPLPIVAAALEARRRLKILAIGASTGMSAARGGHNALLERILERVMKGIDVAILNRGVSGELAESAADRLRLEVTLNQPDLVLWQVGGNDALAYVPVERFESTVRETIRWLKEHKVDVVLVGLQYVKEMASDPHYQAIREAVRRIAAAENVIVVRRYEAMEVLSQAEKGQEPLLGEEIERSGAAYACMAQYVARAITASLFARGTRTKP